jgi:hypothetical protein
MSNFGSFATMSFVIPSFLLEDGTYSPIRNEHFLGFVEEPRVYSDIFVDRGKQGVTEKNLRLTEIDNVGELAVYGNGFFKVRKQ